ncbi:MAG: hypothetical protein WC554_14870 [Clostridia bacterium]
MTPFLTDIEIKTINDALDKKILNWEDSNIFRWLEWGSGNSSVYYVNLLASKKIHFEFYSMEHNPEWYKNAKRLITNPNFHIYLFDYNKYTRGELVYTCMKKYVEFPRSLNIKFDFIFIDGRKRVRCLKESKLLLNKGGILFLDNAERAYYSEGMSLFPSGHIIHDKKWDGWIFYND